MEEDGDSAEIFTGVRWCSGFAVSRGVQRRFRAGGTSRRYWLDRNHGLDRKYRSSRFYRRDGFYRRNRIDGQHWTLITHPTESSLPLHRYGTESIDRDTGYPCRDLVAAIQQCDVYAAE
jgi:hypothetical protein